MPTSIPFVADELGRSFGGCISNSTTKLSNENAIFMSNPHTEKKRAGATKIFCIYVEQSLEDAGHESLFGFISYFCFREFFI